MSRDGFGLRGSRRAARVRTRALTLGATFGLLAGILLQGLAVVATLANPTPAAAASGSPGGASPAPGAPSASGGASYALPGDGATLRNVPPQPHPPKVPTEKPALRTSNSDTTQNPDGTYTADYHVNRINYRDAAGAWQPIDLSLVPTGTSCPPSSPAPSPAPSASPTDSPAPAASPAPSSAPLATATSTALGAGLVQQVAASPSPSVAPTPTSSPSVAPTPSSTPSLTPAPSPSPSPSPSPAPTAAPTDSPSPAPSASPSPSPSPVCSGSYDLMTKANDVGFTASSTDPAVALANATYEAYTLSVRVPGLTSTAVPLAGHSLAFPDGPNADVTLDPVANGYEFGAVLTSPSSPNTYAFAISAPGLTATLASDGQTIVFADPTICAPTPPTPAPTASPSPAPSGSPTPSASLSPSPSASPSSSGPPVCLPTVIAEIAAPALSEANGAGSDPKSVSVALDTAPAGLNPGEVLATYTIDPAYLAAAGRTFPVTLDPSTIYTYCEQTGLSGTCTQHSGATGQDTLVSSGNPNSTETFTVLRVGASAESGYLWGTNREMLYFPQVALGDGAQVVSASVNLYQTANYSSGQSIIAYADSGTWGTSTTWNTQPGVVAGLSSKATAVNASTGWVDINATTIVNEQYVLSTVAQTQTSIWNYGFTLELTNETKSEVQFDNNANGPAGKQPELVISYTIPAVSIGFDLALGPDWAPNMIAYSGSQTLPVVVTNNSGFTMPHYTAGSTDYYKVAAIEYFAGYPSIDYALVVADLPNDIASGAASVTIPITLTTFTYQDTIRLDLIHVYTDAGGITTTNYGADWAWQSKYYARNKNTLDPGNVHWTGNSVIERDEFSVSEQGTGPDQVPTKSVSLPDGSTASIGLNHLGASYLTGPPGVGFNDLGSSVGLSYYYDSFRNSCTGVLLSCGWGTNFDENLTYIGGHFSGNQYVDAQGNPYPLTESPEGQLQSGAPVQIDHNRATLFDDSQIGYWSTTTGTVPTWTTAQAFSGLYSYSETSANAGFVDLASGGTEIINPDINQFPYVSFAMKGVSTPGAAVGFEIKDVTTNVTNWLFYTAGTDFTIGTYSKIALGGSIASWNNTVNRYIRQDVSGQHWTNVSAYDDLQVVGLELRGNGTAGGTAYFDAMHFDPRGSGVINDNTPTWTSGGTAASVDMTPGEIYAGSQSIKVTPTTPSASPTAASAAAYNQFPYITWAWKKVGGNSVGIEFLAKDVRTNATKTILYYAGTDENFDVPNSVIPVQVSPTVPTSWTVVTRDLLADARQALGFYKDYNSGNLLAQAASSPSPDSVTGVSYSLVVPDGQYGLFDNLNYSNTPHGTQTGDDYIVTEPGGATHNFNRDGILTSIRDLDGNTTTLNWTYTPLSSNTSNPSNANYQLNYVAAPGDGQAVSGGTARRRIVATYGTNTVRFTEQLGTTSSFTGRYEEFDGNGTVLTTVIPPSRSAPCATSAPTGCINYGYTGGTAGSLAYVFDPRSDGTTTSPGHDVIKIQYNSNEQATEIDDLSGGSATALLHIDTFDAGTSFPNTVQWEDAAGLAAPGGNVQTRFEDLDPNDAVLNEYAPVACAGTNCSSAVPGDKLASYQTDGLARTTWQIQYRGLGQTLPAVSRRSTLASVAIDNFGDPIDGADTIWTQSPEQYTASVGVCGSPCQNVLNPLATPDAYRTFIGYDQFGQPASVATPHLDAQAGLYTGSVISPGPLGYWRLNDTNSTMVDSSGFGFSGTYSSGGVTHSQPGALVGDPTNAATKFASTSGYASVSLPSLTGFYAVEAWVNPANTSNQQILGSRGPSEYSYDLQLYNGKIHSDIGTGSAWLTTAADAGFVWQANTWYFIAEVVTPSTWTIYLNGAVVGSGGYASSTPLVTNSTHTFAIGNIRTGSGGFDGSLDEVALYNGAISPAQIATQYNAGRDAVVDTAATTYSTVDGGSGAVHFIATGHPVLSTDQFLANPGFESGTDGWTGDGIWTATAHTGVGAVQLNGGETASQEVTLLPGQTFRFGFAGYKSSGTGLTYDVTYQQTSGAWAEIPGLGSHTLTATAWPGPGATSAAWNATVPFDGTGRVRMTFGMASGSGTDYVDDVALYAFAESHTYGGNGLLATSTDANGVVTATNYAPSTTTPAIFPTSVVRNSGGTGGANVANTTTTYTYDVWGRVLTTQDPDLAGTSTVSSTTAYVSSGNGFDTEIASNADALGNTATYTYDPVGNVLTVTPPNGAAETTTKTYTFQNAVATIIPPTDASGHASVTTNTYNAQGQLTQTAQDSSGLNVLTTDSYDEYGRQTGSVADSGGIAATTAQTYDFQGNPLAHTVYQSPGLPEATTTYYDAAGTADATQAPTAPSAGSAAPSCSNGLHSGGSPYCDTFSFIGFDGSTTSSIDAYAKTTVANTDFAGHPVRTIANFVTGTYHPVNPDQDITTSATFDVLGRPVSTTDTLGVTTISTYDPLGRITLRETCDTILTCTTYTWNRTDYTPAGRTWKTSTQGDQTNFATGDSAVAWTETIHDVAGRAIATLANYDVTGNGDTWGSQTNAGTYLDGFETGLSSDWVNTSDGLLSAGATSSLDLTSARTGLASQAVLTSGSTTHTGARWALSTDRSGSFVFQSGLYYHLHAMVMSSTSGKTLQGFLGTTSSSCSTSTVTTTGAWQSIDCTWHPSSAATSGVEAVVRQADASASSITFRIDDVAVFESDSTGAPVTATPTNVAVSVSAYDPDGHVTASTLAPGHLAKDGTIGETGIPVTATTYDHLGRVLAVTVDATAGATGSYPSLVGSTPALVADIRLNEPATSTTAADLVSAASLTAASVTFGGTSPLANASKGPAGSAGSGSFNGTSSVVSRSSAVMTNTDNFSLAAWFKYASTPSAEQAIVFNGTGSGGGYGLALTSSGHLGARYGTSSFIDTGTIPSTNTWHLAVLVRNAGSTTIYLDGAAVGSPSGTAPGSPAAAFSIGREDASTGRYFAGSIAEVAAFTAPLSAATISALYAAGNPSGTATADQNLTTAYAYDGLGRRTDVMDPAGIVSHAVYDHLGRTTSGIANYAPGDPTQSGSGVDVTLNATSLAAYDELGEVTATCSPDAVVASCTSANIGTSNLAWHYAYSFNGHRYATTPPVNATLTALDPTEVVYDAADQRITTTYSCPSGATITYGTACTSYTRRVNDTTYDGIGRLTESVVANSSNTTQITNDTTYDGAGDVLTQSFNGTPISEGTSSAAFTFDALERPSTTSVNSVSQTSLTYAPGGQVATRSDSLVSATASSFTYDPLGRLVTAYSPLFGSSSNKVGFTWRLDGLLDGRSQYSGLASLAYTYDGAKRPLTECSSSTCSGATVDVERSYDRTSNVASETQTLTGANTNQNGTQSFTYDALDRVTGSTLGAITKSYTYDASGNRLTATDGGVTSTFTYDRADEIIKNNYASTDHSFTYDAYGNLTGESVSNGGSAASTSYVYDLADRMTKITQADGSIVGFTFDSLGRHATRTTGLTPTTIDTFGYVGSSDVVVQDFENQASVTINAAIDASADRLMTSTGVSSNAWLIPDLHGNVIGQTGTTGTVTDAFRYDCYGLAEGTTLTGSIPTPWRYQGRLLEATSAGRDLYDFTARSYAPDLGAFTQLDSVAGSAQNPASLNRYLYAAANPETLVDPSGHAARHPNNGSSCGPTCQAGSTATCDVHCQQDKRDSGIPPPSAPPTKPPDPTSSLSCSASWRTYTCRTPDQIAIDNKINAGIGDTLSDILGAAWRQATCLATGAYAPMNCSSTVMDVAQTTIDPVGTGTAIGNQWAADLNSGDPRRQTHAASSILLSLFGLATAAVGLPEADSSIVDDTIPAYARSAYGPVPSELRSGVLVDHPICVYCGRSQSISLDHISANKQDWISGGWRDSFAVRTARANNPENLTGACILCNSTKGARVLGPGDGQWWPPAWLDEEWFPFGGPPN